MPKLRTPRGRLLEVFGNTDVLTLDRMETIGQRLDSDPRIATVSVVSHPAYRSAFLRATGLAGVAVVVAQDLTDVVGPVDDLVTWSQQASERGFWHDWWLTSAVDVQRAEQIYSPPEVDVAEEADRSGSHFLARRDGASSITQLSITVDATWLGPFQTGAQVMTTSAIEALATQSEISRITLTGINDLPDYAHRLRGQEKIRIHNGLDELPQSDIMWYPNQIDQRSNIGQARERGRRVITTYLDLIAYDIPKYHGSAQAWQAYRALQRRIALSVDGITTISADVAARLMKEVPLLDSDRVLPLPLGLDHIDSSEGAKTTYGDDLGSLVDQLKQRPFLLVLGNDFQHKNRDFAIAVWEQVLQSGRSCDLVLAGLHVKSSSSKPREQELLRTHVDLRGRAHLLDHVSEASRTWLLANAAVVVYPSSAEGFGFVPYEAAALGTPSVFTMFGPLAEISQVTDAPKRWSIQEYVSDVNRLLDDQQAREKRIEDLRRAVEQSSWQNYASALTQFFVRIASMPPVLTSTINDAADAAALAAVLGSRTYRALAPVRSLGNRFRR